LVPALCRQRVRQAGVVVEVVDGKPSRVARSTFPIRDIDADGSMEP